MAYFMLLQLNWSPRDNSYKVRVFPSLTKSKSQSLDVSLEGLRLTLIAEKAANSSDVSTLVFFSRPQHLQSWGWG